MGIHVYWETAEQTIVRLDFAAQWSWADYDTAITEAKRLMTSVKHTVDVISNRLLSPGLPLADFYPHVRYSVEDVPPNLGLIVVVGADRTTETILSIFFKTTIGLSHKLVFMRSLDEAQAFLAGQQAQRHRKGGVGV